MKFGFLADPRSHPVAAALVPPVETWLDSAGLSLFKRSAFDRGGDHKAAFSGLRVAAISIKNDPSHVDDALESMKPFARHTQSMQLALLKTRAIDGESLTARMAAFGART